MIKIGPTGLTITGHVLDCNKQHLEAKLQDYDSQLYLVWNGKKKDKNGVWELRRRPEKKTAIYQGTYQDTPFFKIEYKENNFEHHVKDFRTLNYLILEWVKTHDEWKRMNYVKGDQRQLDQWHRDITYNENKFNDEAAKKVRDETIYLMMQEKRAIKDWKELILSGVNPAAIANHWK